MVKAVAPENVDSREKILAVGQRIMAAKGFSGVGINEILQAAGVPKGSFYHYFDSKEMFGEALIESYFSEYHAEIDKTLAAPGRSMAQRLMTYWKNWQSHQSFLDCQGKCLAVKLGAEVADLSEAMRLAMKQGTSGITSRLAKAIEAGVAEGSLAIDGDPDKVAQSLYQLWLGASVLAKIARDRAPFAIAMATTRQILLLPA